MFGVECKLGQIFGDTNEDGHGVKPNRWVEGREPTRSTSSI